MTFYERLLAALYVSEIWYSGFEYGNQRPKFRNYCRARAVVMFDRIITGREEVELP